MLIDSGSDIERETRDSMSLAVLERVVLLIERRPSLLNLALSASDSGAACALSFGILSDLSATFAI